MSFMDQMEKTLNGKKTLTDNGAIAYKTSSKKILDFNFAITSFRNATENEIQDNFTGVYFENPLLAIKYLFYVGDVREGVGERKIFRACFDWLIESRPEIARNLVGLIPEYTRWDNVARLINDKDVGKTAVDFIKSQLNDDCENMANGNPVSLCAKWLPSVNASSPETRKLGKYLTKALGWTEKKYRKTLSELRKYLDVVEVKMSDGNWKDINYETVPSKANLIYSKAFLKNDKERREEYLNSLQNCEAKINASVLQPHEIVSRYCRLNKAKSLQYWNLNMMDIEDPALEALWKALPNMSIENTLVVRDGSASMTWERNCGGSRPIDVATALAIYMAEHNSGEWKDKFITFSASPKIVDLKNCRSLRDKLRLTFAEDDCANTNIYKTMELVLRTAIDNKLSQDEMPKAIIICSDMQFDARFHNFDESLFDSISKEYELHGYKLPRICFWNLSGYKDDTIPMQKNENGLILCSGFSVQIMKMFMSGRTDPYDILVEQLNSERYQPIEDAVKELI